MASTVVCIIEGIIAVITVATIIVVIITDDADKGLIYKIVKAGLVLASYGALTLAVWMTFKGPNDNSRLGVATYVMGMIVAWIGSVLAVVVTTRLVLNDNLIARRSKKDDK